jgi:hypothetical protein
MELFSSLFRPIGFLNVGAKLITSDTGNVTVVHELEMKATFSDILLGPLRKVVIMNLTVTYGDIFSGEEPFPTYKLE